MKKLLLLIGASCTTLENFISAYNAYKIKYKGKLALTKLR